MKLTEDNFDEIYTPIQNHLDEDATLMVQCMKLMVLN
jgi:hypothetical protein